MARAPLLRWLFAALALLVTLVCASARAQPPAALRGRLVLSLPNGAPGPLVLAPSGGGWFGQMTVTNVGSEPLGISRLAVRGDEDDVRSPSRVNVRFAEGAATSATVPPGAAKDILVSWTPDRDARVRQAFGHIVLTSTDEQAGEVAMGFRAQLPTGLGWIGEHALALLVLWPLILVPVAASVRFAGERVERHVGCVSMGVAIVELLLALWTYDRFVPGVGRAEGNDGFQLVERSVWIRSVGAEFYLGVDGTSLPLVVLVAVLAAVAAVLTRPDRRPAAYHAAFGLLTAGMVGVLVALDLVVFFVAWQTVLFAAALLVGGAGSVRGPQVAAKLSLVGAIGSAAMLLAFAGLTRASGRTFLVDGAPLAHTLSIPELARTSFALRGPVLGVPFVQLEWALLLVAVAASAPLVPLHGWLPEALEEGPAGAAILLGGAAVALGPYLLLRMGLGAVPQGARAMGPTVAALGVLTALWGALCAMAQRDVRRFFGYATLTTTGTCLYGIGTLTAQGVAGAVMALVARGLAAALVLGFASALERRVRTCHAGRFGGLAAETPGLAALAAVGFAVSSGVPGLAGAWGAMLALLGGFVWHPALALLLVLALVVAVAAHGRIARLLLLGALEPSWRMSEVLAPFGGRIPDATPSEVAALAPLLVVSALLGFWPSPVLAPASTSARDLVSVVAQE